MKNYVLRIAVIFAVLAVIVFSAQSRVEGQAEPVGIKLLDQGSNPRKELRYEFTPRQTEIMVFEGTMSVEFEMAGQSKPHVKTGLPSMTFTFVTKDISPQGNAVLETTLTNIDGITVPGESQQAAAATQKTNESLRRLVGTVQRYVMSPQGTIISFETDQSPSDDPQMQLVLDRVSQAPTVSFPKEQVGEGARWEVTTSKIYPRIKFSQTVVYTLLELKGDNIKLKATLKQEAPVQEMPSAPGTVAKLESFDSAGSSVIEIQLTKVVPTSIALDLSMDTSVVVTQLLKTKIGMEVKMHREDK